MKISVVINCDTRRTNHQQGGLFNGVVAEDFLTDGIYNKVKFFEGFDAEFIVFIDEHYYVPESTLAYLRTICNTVVVRKHTHEEKFNDYNYLSALQLARGEIICHFDQDIAAFARSKESLIGLIGLLEGFTFVSYPSPLAPLPAHDPNYDYVWCSTRFFMCKREALDFTEIAKCLRDSDYLYGKYPASVRNPWVEHVLGLHAKYNGKGVIYPPIDLNEITIFCWDNYERFTLKRLNELPYEEVKKFVESSGGIHYPNNLSIK